MKLPFIFHLSSFIFFIFLVLAAALALPHVLSDWFLNRANADIAYAASLPSDAPQRLTALADAEDQLNRAQTFANDGRIPLARARVDLARGNPAQAADALKNASPALQSDFVAQYIWAQSEMQSGQTQAALDHLRAAGAFTFYLQQAHRAVDGHQWQAAAASARIAAGIDTASADAHYVLGDALSRQNLNDPEALRELERAGTLTQDKEFLSGILSRRAEVLAAQGKLQDALQVFDEARRAAPIDARPRTGYALAQIRLQPDSRAQNVALLKQVVTDSSWYTAAYIALADLAEQQGDNQSAEQWLAAGLQKNPDNPTLLFTLGQFYARQHQTGQAKTTLLLALKYETHADDLQAVSRALAALGTP